MSKILKSGNISEELIQKTVLQWIALYPDLKDVVIHIPNEGRRTARFGKLLKDMGMKSGVSDLFIAMGCHGFFGAWIELKSKNGSLSQSQKKFIESMRQQNYFAAVCHSIEDCIETIKWYCFDN